MAQAAGQAVAGNPLLTTKLYVPKWRPGLISRPRLVARLDQRAGRKLTLVSAPAGFGKTTLLAEWLAAAPDSGRSAAWVSLDQDDNDPALFWAYVIAALQTIHPGIGANALSLLQSPQPPPIESVLTSLINEVAQLEDEVALILDDLHIIDAQAIHSALAFFLDHLPPQMHLVIASRSDPPLPLARLRARGESIELRASELRFTPDEAAAFLKDAMGLEISAADVAALETRTEGWIAGLQLAALSMQGRDDAHGFVQAFAGDDRYIMDYLVDEVLQRQPPPVRSFLLQTSILERLSGPLCGAVTGRDAGQELLETLERGNLFVVPLDDKRHWYRYHHLFADVLRAHAMNEQPEQVPTWHRRASDWYEDNGLRAAAIHHALTGEDFARAADLVELAALPMLGNSQEKVLYGWLTALPDTTVRARPVLSVYHAFASFGRDGLEAADTRLRDAERWLDTIEQARQDTPPDGMVVADETAFRSLPGTIAIARAYHAGALGDVTGTVDHARRALDLLPEDDDVWRGAAGAILGITSWNSGDLEAAYESFTEGMARLRKAGYLHLQIMGVHILADIHRAKGRLREAVRTYENALEVATAQGEPIWGTTDLYVGLSELAHERGDLDTAIQYLQRSKELGEHVGTLETRHRWYVAMARIKASHGDLDSALALLDEAERKHIQGPDIEVRPVPALRAQVWVAQGKLDEASSWVRDQNLSVDDELSFMREFEHMTLARVLIARYRGDRDDRSIQQALGLLDRLLHAAEDGKRTGSVIEILVLQAVAQEARSNVGGALAPLRRAVDLAEPEGYVRVFIAEGAAMRNHLRHAAAGGVATPYILRLLSALDGDARPVPNPARAATAGLAEPLTEREVEVLRLIAAGMRNHEIADQLYISVSTVKRHIANAYGKLGVGHRTEAIARANELGLL